MDPNNSSPSTPQPEPLQPSQTPPPSSRITLAPHQLKLILLAGIPLLLILFLLTSLVDSSWKKQSLKKPPLPTPTAITRLPANTQIIPTTTESRPLSDYKITDGSVYDAKKNTLLIDKKSLTKTDDGDHYQANYVFDIIPSPDKQKLILFTYGDISSAVIFLYDIKTHETVFADFAEEAVWSPNNTYIAYTHRQADVGPLNLYVINVLTKKEVTTDMTVDRKNTSFTNLEWSKDNKTINADYETIIPGKDTPWVTTDKGETTVTVKGN